MYQKRIRTVKKQKLIKDIHDSKLDIKSLYKIVNDLTGVKCENPMPECESKLELANKFADYFINKIDKIKTGTTTFY